VVHEHVGMGCSAFHSLHAVMATKQSWWGNQAWPQLRWGETKWRYFGTHACQEHGTESLCIMWSMRGKAWGLLG